VRYDLTAIVGLPLVVWAASLGCGLALERVLRLRLDNALLLPLGLCVSLVLAIPGYAAGNDDRLSIVLLAGVALSGLVLARGGLRARLNPGWPGAAGLAAYVLFVLPVIASGHWTWSGYNFVNDSAVEMLLADHLKHFGTALGNIPESSEREFLASYLSTGYPLGSQSLLATFSGLTATPVPALYQGFIAGLAAMGAVALATLTRQLLSARLAAVIAFAAISANLTYQYALQGGIKEIGLLATLCATVALAREAYVARPARPYAGVVLVAVPAAAALATYNAVAVPFIGAIVLLLGSAVLILARARPSRRWVPPLVAAGALTALLAVPAVKTFSTFFHFARVSQASTGVGATQFGQLVRPLPLSQISGVWLAGDYRVPLAPGHHAATLTLIATVLMLGLLLPGLIWALRRREIGPLLILGAMGLVTALVYPRVSPYAQGKLLAIASPAVVLVALLALACAGGRGARRALSVLATGVGAALVLAVMASDLIAYGYDRVAPTARIDAISQTGDHFAGQGLVLWNEFEEYAKYFARAARISVPFEALTPQQVELRVPAPFYGHYFDLDQELLSFVERYPVIVTRRSPAASRPPADYQLVYGNAYYLGWRRTARPQVLRHLPEQQLYSPASTVACSALRTLVANAPAGTQLIAARPPELTWFEPLYSSDRSFGWGIYPPEPGAILPNSPGHASGVLTVRGNAHYAVWLQGDFPRTIQVRVDGRLVGAASGADTPGQWHKVAALYLSPGPHAVSISKTAGHRHFGPGDWAVGVIGPAALQREVPEKLETVPVARWRTVCGTPADWVELVRP
jgi:hypothetical protein